MKLGIGLVMAGGYANFIPTGFFHSIYALHSEILQGKLNDRLPPEQHVTATMLIWSGKFPTDCARNEICQKALDKDVDALLFIDADHTFLPEAVARLISHGLPVVTGLYHVKSPPFHPNLYLVPNGAHTPGTYKTVHYGQGIFPVDRCGAGALLIRREALEAIRFPWFRYQADPNPPYDLSVSEDFFFCQRAQETGHTILADWESKFDHIAVYPVSEEHRQEYISLMEQGVAEGSVDPSTSIVACGFPEGYTLPSGHHVPPYKDTAEVSG